MKNVLSLFILLSIVSCHRKTSIQKSPDNSGISGVTKVNPTLADTLKRDIYDTADALKEFAFYETNKDTVQFLSKYFEKNLCNPGNFNHPTYLAYQKKANELIPELKERVKKILNNSEQSNMIENCPSISVLKKKLVDVERLYGCTIFPIPYYYLTFNVVERKGSDMDFLKFFNLDTASIYFAVQLLDELIGIVKYSDLGAVKISCFYPQDSLGYNKITSLKKEAILIKRDLVNFGASYQNFGFLINNKLFFGQCDVEEIIQRNEGSQNAKSIYNQICEFITPQEFYLKPTSSGNNLARIIKDGFISKSN